jgi:DNA polymerase-3 subunit gamma/tau
MGQAFYRKYRSKNLDEVVGQEHVVKTLKNALKSGRVSHAYLFTGPRGVGKTSVARILAHAVNDLDYSGEQAHLDIIEIDAASNRRIDEIRDLRERVHTMPTSGKYKIYIIDEVHMLTREAFNALLKTLEEPPAHVIFILATTEAHKLPDTIVSRTQRFSFKPVSTADVVKHLSQIAKKEKINIDDAALQLVAEHGDGSFRDSISLLEQLGTTHQKKITLADVEQMLGLAPNKLIDELLGYASQGQVKKLVESIAAAEERGFHAASLAKQLSVRLREQMLDGSSSLAAEQSLSLMAELLEVPSSSNPVRTLELALLGTALLNTDTLAEPKAAKPRTIEQKATETTKSIKTTTVAEVKKTSAKAAAKFTLDTWPSVLDTVKKRHATLHSILRLAAVSFDSQSATLTLAFQYPLHQKRLNDAKSRQLLLDAINDKEITLEVIVDKTLKPAAQKPKKPEAKVPEVINSVANVFGGAEVLDS